MTPLVSELHRLAASQRKPANRDLILETIAHLEKYQGVLGGESFEAIRRVDREPIGDFSWVTGCDASDISDYDDPGTQYEIARFYVEPISVYTVPNDGPLDDFDCLACWRADGGVGYAPKFRCPACDSPDCPKAQACINSCLGDS